MNTTNIKVISLTVTIGAIALLAANKLTAGILPTTAVTVSYLAVGALLLLAATDYRVGPKNYADR